MIPMTPMTSRSELTLFDLERLRLTKLRLAVIEASSKFLGARQPVLAAACLSLLEWPS